VNLFRQPGSLHLTLPDNSPNDIAVVLKIDGDNLRDFTPPPAPQTEAVVVKATNGNVLSLNANLATTHGGVAVESGGGKDNLGFWDNPDDYVSWEAEVPTAGEYEVLAIASTQSFATECDVTIGNKHVSGSVPVTGGWGSYVDLNFGKVKVSKAGRTSISVKALHHDTWKPMNLRAIILRKV